MTALGGLVGWWLVDQLHGWLPYFLVVASSSFIYVALADLIPQLQKRLPARQTLSQIAWLATGIAAGHAGEHARPRPWHGHASRAGARARTSAEHEALTLTKALEGYQAAAADSH